jgi:hypothetical protein
VVRTRTPPGVDREAHDIDVYATGSTIITDPERGAPGHGGAEADGVAGDQLRRAVTVLHDGLDHARRFHAKAGPRMGPSTHSVASTREGSKSEIIRPILLDPSRAWEVAGSGQLFADPIPRLSIDRGPDSAHAAYPVWTASLRTGWVTHRSARLQVTASPSFNVTVLELIPATPRRIGNRSFLRVGLPVVEELARRLEASRTHNRGNRGNDGRIRDR